jgi:TonB family protein
VLTLAALALAQEPTPAPAVPPDAPAEELPPLLEDPALLDFVQATYPPEAEAARLEATVRLLLDIDATGAVTHVEVVTPAGHGFDEAAVAAAQAFKFSPAKDATGPVPVSVEFDYAFKLLPAPDAPPPEPPITVEGSLVEMATRATIAGAAVQVLDGDKVLASTQSDAQGAFQFRGIPPGKYTLRAFDPDHRKTDAAIEVVDGQVTSVKSWLKRDSYRQAGIIGIYETPKVPEVTRRSISIDEVRRVPGTFGDPVRVIQNLPGVARAPFGIGLLVIRGANPQDSNVYVDGVEVPLVYHLGGYRSIVNANLISSVDYLPGTYSASYGRSTGGVIDVRSKTEYPDQTKITWRSDFLDTGLFATGKIGKKVGFAAGIRRSYLDALLAVVLPDTGFYAAPRWFDYQLKVQALDIGENEASAMLFGFQDDLLIRTDPDAESTLGLHYSTHRLVLRYAHPLSDTLKFELQPSFGLDGVRFGLGQDINLDTHEQRVDLRGDLAWSPSEAFTLRLGLDTEVNRLNYAIYVASVPVDGDDPLSENEPITAEDGVWTWQPDPYLEAVWTPLKDRERFSLVAGTRLSTVIQPDEDVEVSPDPRLGVRLEVIEGGTLKAGTGLYHQPPQLGDSPNDRYFEQAWSSEFGWEQQFTPAIRADVTGFYRKMDNLGGGDDPGIGRAYGMEVMLRHAPVGRFFGWISYTLSKSERNDDPDDKKGWYPFDFDQTHILTAVAGYRLPLDLDVSSRFQYVTGNPYTPYVGGLYLMDSGSYVAIPSADTNSLREAPYYALDLRVEKVFTYKFWQMSVLATCSTSCTGRTPSSPSTTTTTPRAPRSTASPSSPPSASSCR